MDLSWAKALIDAGGWVFAAAVIGTVLGLVIRGDLVPGKVAEAQGKRLDALERSLRDDVVPVLREVGKGTTQAGVVLDFLSDFVREVARDRRGEGQ